MRAILVPVDGSSLAETAFPTAFAIARREHARVEAVTVLAPPLSAMSAGGAPVLDTRLEHDLRTQAEEYLVGLRRRFGEMAPDVAATATVLVGRTAEQLAAYADSHGHDLIVMTTHGRSGVNRLWLGSVADGLLRHSNRPVLLLRDESAAAPRADGAAAGEPIFANVVVPIDVCETSDAILADAIALAGRTATYHLVNVVVPLRWGPPPSALEVVTAGTGTAGTAADLLGVTRDSAVSQLAAIATRLKHDGIVAQTHVPIHHSPAEAILTYAHECGATLIAMSSHGRGAAGRALLGSVADKVVRGAHVPVLVRVPRTDR